MDAHQAALSFPSPVVVATCFSESATKGSLTFSTSCSLASSHPFLLLLDAFCHFRKVLLIIKKLEINLGLFYIFLITYPCFLNLQP